MTENSYATKSSLVTMGCPTFTQNCPFRGAVANPVYLLYPWTQPTYHYKRHPDPTSRFATVHATDRQTDRQTENMGLATGLY